MGMKTSCPTSHAPWRRQAGVSLQPEVQVSGTILRGFTKIVGRVVQGCDILGRVVQNATPASQPCSATLQGVQACGWAGVSGYMHFSTCTTAAQDEDPSSPPFSKNFQPVKRDDWWSSALKCRVQIHKGGQWGSRRPRCSV